MKGLLVLSYTLAYRGYKWFLIDFHELTKYFMLSSILCWASFIFKLCSNVCLVLIIIDVISLSLLSHSLPVSRSICVAQTQNPNWQPNSKQTSPSIYPARCLRSLSVLPAVCAALSLQLCLSLSVFLSLTGSPPPAPGQQFNWNAHVINSEVVLPAILPHCVFECLPFAPTPILQASSFISEKDRDSERQWERECEALNKLRAGTKFLVEIIVITPKSFIINFNVWQQTAQTAQSTLPQGEARQLQLLAWDKGQGAGGRSLFACCVTWLDEAATSPVGRVQCASRSR